MITLKSRQILLSLVSSLMITLLFISINFQYIFLSSSKRFPLLLVSSSGTSKQNSEAQIYNEFSDDWTYLFKNTRQKHNVETKVIFQEQEHHFVKENNLPLGPSLSPGYKIKTWNWTNYGKKASLQLHHRSAVYIARAMQVASICSLAENVTQDFSPSLYGRVPEKSIFLCPIQSVLSAPQDENLRIGFSFSTFEFAQGTSAEQDPFDPKVCFSKSKGRKMTTNFQNDNSTTAEKFFKVIFVRHPFSRLFHFYKSFIQTGLMSVDKSRKKKSSKRPVTFANFILNFIERTKHLKTFQDWFTEMPCLMPYWRRCNVCKQDYDLYLKHETLFEDQQFLYYLFNISSHSNRSISKPKFKVTWFDVSIDAEEDASFRSLTSKKIGQLHRIYKLDFQLFGYNLLSYKHGRQD